MLFREITILIFQWLRDAAIRIIRVGFVQAPDRFYIWPITVGLLDITFVV